MDDVPDTSDDADAPIIVPPPNQILRRTARTKIRKPNLSGDGGGHRFPASRRKSGGRTNSMDQITSPTDGSSSSHGHEAETAPHVPVPAAPVAARKRTLEIEDQDNRRFTYTEEASIFDAYAESPEDEKSPSPPPPSTQPTSRLISEATAPRPPPAPVPVLGPAPASRPSISSPQAPPEVPIPQAQAAPSSVLYQPQPQRLLSPQQQQQVLQHPSRSPSPETASQAQEIQRPDSRSSIVSEAPSVHSVTSTLTDKRKEKDKKSLWRKVGGNSDKAAKKPAKEKEKEKDSGFFGSLFGGGKKKQEEHPPSNIGGGAGPATAAALLGASKSSNKAYSPSISPQLGNPYARYPIHVERAIYRLSHIKLANPRRPLYEQVLISNLMFWYLGVINKSNQGPGQNQNQSQQSPKQTQGSDTTQNAPGQGAGTGQDVPQTAQPISEKDQLGREREQREREEREMAEKERAEAKEQQQQQRREPKRGSLTKPPPAGRRAEMPVKGPQYHLQSQVIEQEYGNGGGGMAGPPPVTRTSSAPPPSMAQTQGYNMNGGYSARTQSMQPQQPPHQQEQLMYSQPNGNTNYYYGRSASVDFTASGTSPASGLPPGAMPPADPTWLASAQVVGGTLPTRMQQPSSHGYTQSADYAYNQQSAPRSSRSPPGNIAMNNTYDWNRKGEMAQGGKAPSRSLSANAVAPGAPQNRQYDQYQQYSQYGQTAQPPNGGLKKKVASASAVAPDRDRRQQRTSDDEDVPLAMWQQQRRK